MTESILGFITVVLGLVTAIIVACNEIFSKPKTNHPKSTSSQSSDIRKDQLNLLYGPLYAMYLQSAGKFTPDHLQAIDRIIVDHHTLAAPALLKAWLSFQKAEDSGCDQFESALISNYHQTKKLLGLDYDEKSINYSHISTKPHRYLTIFIVLIYAVILYVYGLYRYAVHTASGLDPFYPLLILVIAFVIVIICGIFTWIFCWISKHRKNI